MNLDISLLFKIRISTPVTGTRLSLIQFDPLHIKLHAEFTFHHNIPNIAGFTVCFKPEEAEEIILFLLPSHFLQLQPSCFSVFISDTQPESYWNGNNSWTGPRSVRVTKISSQGQNIIRAEALGGSWG